MSSFLPLDMHQKATSIAKYKSFKPLVLKHNMKRDLQVNADWLDLKRMGTVF